MPHQNDLVNWLSWVNYAIDTEPAVGKFYDGTAVANWVLGPLKKTVFVDRLHWKATGANDTTVGRVFINNGKDNAVAANNVLIDEVNLSGDTASATSARNTVVADFGSSGIWLPAGFRINVIIGEDTNVTGWSVSAFVGKYSESVGDPGLYKT